MRCAFGLFACACACAGTTHALPQLVSHIDFSGASTSASTFPDRVAQNPAAPYDPAAAAPIDMLGNGTAFGVRLLDRLVATHYES